MPVIPTYMVTVSNPFTAFVATPGSVQNQLTGGNAIIYADTPWGMPGVWVHQGQSNYVGNPYFALDTASWSAANGSIARDTSWAFDGPASGLLTATGANAEAYCTLATGTTFQLWLKTWVRNNAAGTRTFRFTRNGALWGTTFTVAAGEVKELDYWVSTAWASLDVYGIRVTDSQAGDTFNIGYAGAISIGSSNVAYMSPLPPIDASGGIWGPYSWAGVAHNSRSTRPSSYFRMNISTGAFNYESGEVTQRVFHSTITSGAYAPAQHGGWSGNAAQMNPQSVVLFSHSHSAMPFGTTIPANTWYMQSEWWDEAAGQAGWTENAVQRGGTVAISPASRRTDNNVVVGSYPDSFSDARSRIFQYAIWPRKLTHAERMALATAPGPWTPYMFAQEVGGLTPGESQGLPFTALETTTLPLVGAGAAGSSLIGGPVLDILGEAGTSTGGFVGGIIVGSEGS